MALHPPQWPLRVPPLPTNRADSPCVPLTSMVTDFLDVVGGISQEKGLSFLEYLLCARSCAWDLFSCGGFIQSCP